VLLNYQEGRKKRELAAEKERGGRRGGEGRPVSGTEGGEGRGSCGGGETKAEKSKQKDRTLVHIMKKSLAEAVEKGNEGEIKQTEFFHRSEEEGPWQTNPDEPQRQGKNHTKPEDHGRKGEE